MKSVTVYQFVSPRSGSSSCAHISARDTPLHESVLRVTGSPVTGASATSIYVMVRCSRCGAVGEMTGPREHRLITAAKRKLYRRMSPPVVPWWRRVWQKFYVTYANNES